MTEDFDEARDQSKMSELEQLRQEAEQLRNQIRVCVSENVTDLGTHLQRVPKARHADLGSVLPFRLQDIS